VILLLAGCFGGQQPLTFKSWSSAARFKVSMVVKVQLKFFWVVIPFSVVLG
jgi:hypothetical protein